MATTNLYKITVGDVELQSGNGTPDHNAPTGSLYVDLDQANPYINIGAGNWKILHTPSYGSMWFRNENDPTTFSGTSSWLFNTSLAWTKGECSDFQMSGSENYFIQYVPDLPVTASFMVTFNISANYPTGTSKLVDHGLIKNPHAINGPATVLDQWWLRQECSTTGMDYPGTNYTTMVTLAPNDVLGVVVSTESNTTPIYWQHGWMTINKVTNI